MQTPKKGTPEGDKTVSTNTIEPSPSGGGTGEADQDPTDEVDVYYSFHNGFVNKGAMGFCNYFSGDDSDDFVVAPLKPSSCRHGGIPSQTKMDRIYDFGMVFQLTLSDIWGYDSDHIPGKNGDWTEYENTITEAVNDTLSLNHATTGNVIVEVWNEPNGKGFWPYSGQYSYENHFIDTWEYAYNAIKGVNSNLRIVGPTFSGFWWKSTPDNDTYNKTNGIRGFLNHTRERDVFPDIIDWHYPFDTLVNQVNKVKQHLDDKNQFIDGIIISEHVTPPSRKEGNSAYAIAEIERASEFVQPGAYIITSMLDPSGNDNGWLDGLTTYQYEKRGAWWIYKKYADMNSGPEDLGTLVLNTERGDQVELYATCDIDDPNVHILLGTWGTSYSSTTHNTTINLHDFYYFFKPNIEAYADVYKLESNGDGMVGEPYNVGTFQLTFSQGEISTFIINWGTEPEACYYINIHPI